MPNFITDEESKQIDELKIKLDNISDDELEKVYNGESTIENANKVFKNKQKLDYRIENYLTIDDSTTINDCKVYLPARIENATKTFHYTSKIVRPENILGVVEVVKHAKKNNRRVKAISSMHSFSEVTQNKSHETYAIDLSFTDGLIPVNTPDFKKAIRQNVKVFDEFQNDVEFNDAFKDNHINVPAGMIVSHLNEILCSDSVDRQKINPLKHNSLFNMGGADVQTFAGAFSTGTHGTGGKYSAYHDMIKSILFVDQNGDVIRIEGDEEVVTDDFIDDDWNYEITRINSNIEFNAFKVNMGTMGVIYSMVVEIQPMVLLHEEIYHYKRNDNNVQINEKLTWQGIKDTVIEKAKKKTDDDFSTYNVLVNPYVKKDENENLVVEKFVTQVDNYISITPAQLALEKKRRSLVNSSADCSLISMFVLWAVNDKFSNALVNNICTSLSAQNDNPCKHTTARQVTQGYTDLSYHVWHAGTGRLNDFGLGVEYAFPIFDNSDLNIVDEFISKVNEITQDNHNLYLNAPFSLRFVRPGDALLAPNYRLYQKSGDTKEPLFYLFIEVLRVINYKEINTKNAIRLYDLLSTFLLERGGRPHWGLNFGFTNGATNENTKPVLNKSVLSNLYPKFDIWYSFYKKYNSSKIFSNAFTDSIGLDDFN